MISLYKNHKKILWQEADFYGAANLVFNANKPIVYKGSWMHGMGYAFTGIMHINSFIHPDEVNLPVHLVNNKEISKFLLERNIYSTPVGMPYLYTLGDKNSKLTRSNTNLFIPEHNISSTNDKYFSHYVKICRKYNCNKILLMHNDFLKAKAINFDFSEIEPICGSNISDPCSLKRLSQILHSSKRVISNIFGSHLFYGAISGCEIIMSDDIADNYSEIKIEERYNTLKGTVAESFRKKNFPIKELLNSIWMNGSQNEIQEYAEFMLGLGFKQNKVDIQELLMPASFKEKFLLSKSIFQKKLKRKLLGFNN